MFSTHITTLVRTLEDAPDCAAAHSANFFDDSDGMRSLRLRDPLHKEDIYECFSKNNYSHVSGMFLFRAESEKLIPAEADRYLDIYLPCALLNLIIFNGKSKAKYSRLITAGKVEDLCVDFPAVMGASLEINFVQGLARGGYEEWVSLYPKSIAVAGGYMMDSERDWLSHVYKRKMKLELLWHRLRRLLFIFFPEKRKKAEERIKERKRIIKSLY
ncbi:MAG: hypothetical protein IJI37_04790, partial [Opitutales bacterium]|nr:hypothetical protein [Opitutales bacterium]